MPNACAGSRERLLKVRNDAVAHWNAQKSVAEWLRHWQLTFIDIQTLLTGVRQLHDELRKVETNTHADTFGILEKQTREKIDNFVDELRNAAKFRLVASDARSFASELYVATAVTLHDQ